MSRHLGSAPPASATLRAVHSERRERARLSDANRQQPGRCAIADSQSPLSIQSPPVEELVCVRAVRSRHASYRSARHQRLLQDFNLRLGTAVLSLSCGKCLAGGNSFDHRYIGSTHLFLQVDTKEASTGRMSADPIRVHTAKTGFQLPTSLAALNPSSISVSRESPHHMTLFPGGGSSARAR